LVPCPLFLSQLPAPSAFVPYTTLFRSLGSSGCLDRNRIRLLGCGLRALGRSVLDNRGTIGRHELLLELFDRGDEEVVVIVREHRSEEHTSELQSRFDVVCRLLLVKKKE